MGQIQSDEGGQRKKNNHARQGVKRQSQGRPAFEANWQENVPPRQGNVSVHKQVNSVATKQRNVVAPKQGNIAAKRKSPDNPVQNVVTINLPRHVMDISEKIDNFVRNEGDRVQKLIKSNHLTPAHSQTYEDLFAPYMNKDLIVIKIREPHIFQPFQYLNLVKFIECCLVHAPNLKLINLETKFNPDNDVEQRRNLLDITDSLSERGIKLDVEFSAIHDRKIIFNTNYLFRLGKGLHFYEKASGQSRKYFVGMSDQRLRRCQDTNVDVFQFVY